MGKRILVADDSQTIQQAFQLALHGEDVTLISARSFDLAVSAARDQAPDLVIADVTLGDRSGYDLCSAIKAAGGSMPVWILESKQTPYDEARGMSAGADGKLLKPFDSTKLLEAIQAAASRGAAAPVLRTAPTMDAVPAVVAKVDTAPQPEFEDESSYGEFSIDGPKSTTPAPVPAPAPVVAAQAPARAPAPPVAAPVAPPVARPTASVPVAAPTPAPIVRAPAAPIAPAAAPPRPSLIPGLRPGGPRPPAPPPAALKQAPARPAPPPAPVAPPAPVSVAAPAPQAPATFASSIGHAHTVPVDLPGPATPPPVARPAVAIPIVAPEPELETRATARTDVPSAPLAAKIGGAVDAKIAAVSEKGPEYAAIAKLSREIIEQIVWEVVPELAEIIIKEHVERLAKK